MFTRLYKGGSSLQGGTLLQLRNLVNRRNITRDTSGKCNESIHFYELVVRSHILAAAMNVFGMKTASDKPTKKAVLPNKESNPVVSGRN